MAKPGRNTPCPCGSGRKYKKCCLSKDEASSTAMSGQSAVYDPTASTSMTDGLSNSVRDKSRGRSARAVSELLCEQGLGLSPYTVMRIIENPRSPGAASRLRERWTMKKVAAMTTEGIEEQLAAFGVKHTRERLIKLTSGRNSAWTISEVWRKDDSVECTEEEEDFLGLAACELWKRLVPDPPSMEMLDDWMQEGYELVEQGRTAEACNTWWKVWSTLLPRFTPEMRTMNAAGPAFSGYQSVFNWSQDFEMNLRNAARNDEHYAAIGRQYCTEWIAQFSEQDDGMQVSFRRALASFLFRLGETAEMSAVLHNLPEQWPQNVWSHIALADAYSHFFAGEYDLPLDVGKAIGYLEQGLAAEGRTTYDRDVIEERLAELRKPSFVPRS